jgi:anaphase-promoting complex subunit 6
LFIGKEHLQLANIEMAKEWLLVAESMCPTDPLLLNELGIVAFNQGE